MADINKVAQIAEDALRLSAKLAKQLLEVEGRLTALEKSIREPRRPPKPKGRSLSDAEWLAQRRAILKENAKHRWPKKKRVPVAKKLPTKKKAPKR